MKCLTMIGFLALCSIATAAQQSIQINRIYVQSDLNAGYILSHVGQTIPIWGKVSPEIIDCGLTELRSSGMFKRLDSELVPSVAGKYDLDIKPVYNGDPAKYRIVDIIVDKSVGIGEKLLRHQLETKSVKPGAFFMPYGDLGRTIFQAIDMLDTGEPKTLSQNVWINASLTDETSIVLTITKQVPQCGGT